MNRLTEYSNQNGYLLVRIAGPWTEQTARQAIDEIKLEVAQRKYDRLLLDLNQWDKPDTELTRFLSGRYLAEVFRPPFRVAAYSVAGVINKFGENAAVNRGAIYRIFRDEKSAIRWLMEGAGADS